MTEQSNLLEKLRQISHVDSKIAAVLAEKRKLEEERVERMKRVRSLEDSTLEKTRALNERREFCQREERHLKEAQQKLIDRRKALQTIGDYKTQVAAEREIDTVSRQLSVQEENLLKIVEQVEELEQGASEVSAQLASERSEAEGFDSEHEAALLLIEERSQEYAKEREELVKPVPPRYLTKYERIRQKYPMDAVVPLKQSNCGGCFLELGPQTIVEISRGRDLIRCRGCGRILYLEPKEEE